MQNSRQNGFAPIEVTIAVANRLEASSIVNAVAPAVIETLKSKDGTDMRSSGISGRSRHGQGRGHEGGFTLMELMVVAAIAAILAGLAVPSFQAVIAHNRLKSHSTSLWASLLLARSEAIKRNARVVLCKSANGATCTTAGGWQQGWIIFADANNNATLDDGEAVIQRAEALSGDFVLKGNMHVANYVSYSSTGSTKLVSEAFQAGTFTLCQRALSNGKGRKIIISATGRARVSPTVEAACG